MQFFKPKSYLGIDFGAGGLKIVELKKEKNRPVLFTYGFASLGHDVHHLLEKPDLTPVDLLKKSQPAAAAAAKTEAVTIDQKKIDEYAGVIRSVCQAARTVSKQAVVSLPVSAVFHTVVNLPILKKEEFDHAIKAEIRKLLPYPLEDTVLDYEQMPDVAGAKVHKVIVNAVPRPLVAFYTKVFAAAGLKLEALEPESVALARALVGRDQALTLLVDIGAERTNFFIVDQGRAMTQHSIELGGQRINALLSTALGVEPRAIEQFKHDLFATLLQNQSSETGPVRREKFLKLFAPLIDPIVKEIQYSLDLYLRQSGNENLRPEKIILTGGGAMFPYLPELLAEFFKLKCYIGDPWGRVVYQEGLKNVLHEFGPRVAVAIGLSLRSILSLK